MIQCTPLQRKLLRYNWKRQEESTKNNTLTAYGRGQPLLWTNEKYSSF